MSKLLSIIVGVLCLAFLFWFHPLDSQTNITYGAPDDGSSAKKLAAKQEQEEQEIKEEVEEETEDTEEVLTPPPPKEKEKPKEEVLTPQPPPQKEEVLTPPPAKKEQEKPKEITPIPPKKEEPPAQKPAQKREKAQEAGVTVITVQETDLVNLKPRASDPDADKLIYSYTAPLNEDGQWQTTYGDNGDYTITITVSDGELTASKDALLRVKKKEESPSFTSVSPKGTSQIIKETAVMDFKAEASDLNDDPLTYAWKLDGQKVSMGTFYKYESDYSSAGSHTVVVEVSDGTTTISNAWGLTVEPIDRPPVLNLISDVTVKEGETVRITPNASDPDGDELSFTITEPVGDDGVWQTNYEDAGIYTITVNVSDGQLSDNQKVKVTVVNVNRAPVIEDIVEQK